MSVLDPRESEISLPGENIKEANKMNNDPYKNIRDLNTEQMEYLKFCLWYSEDGDNYFYDQLAQEDKDTINRCKNGGRHS